MMKGKIFFQGAAGIDGNLAILVTKMVRWCNNNEIQVFTGSSGNIARLAHKAGDNIVSFAHKLNNSQVPEKIRLTKKFINCATSSSVRISWTKRLGELLLNSTGAVFFPGNLGTLAHLFPFIAFAVKMQKFKIALIGWENDDVTAIYHLIKFMGETGDYVQAFPVGKWQEAMAWVTSPVEVTE